MSISVGNFFLTEVHIRVYDSSEIDSSNVTLSFRSCLEKGKRLIYIVLQSVKFIFLSRL